MPSDESESVLSVKDLRKSFGDVRAVQGLSLQVRAGEVFGFLGPNGAGKTTTIRMMAGLLKADGGSIQVLGQALAAHPRACRRRIGLCPQELVIWETLTCMEQLVFVGSQYDMSYREARSRSLELLDILGLSEKNNRRAGTLSGGMKRRLNLALALVHDPELLILDEPQAGLDPQSRILVREFILSLAEDRTVLLTTHEMDEADRLAGRIGIIDHGRLLVLDTPERLKEAHAGGEILEITLGGRRRGMPEILAELGPGLTALESVEGTLRFTGTGIHEEIPRIFRQLDSGGMVIENVTLRRPTLEDVFISLTGRGLRE